MFFLGLIILLPLSSLCLPAKEKGASTALDSGFDQIDLDIADLGFEWSDIAGDPPTASLSDKTLHTIASTAAPVNYHDSLGYLDSHFQWNSQILPRTTTDKQDSISLPASLRKVSEGSSHSEVDEFLRDLEVEVTSAAHEASQESFDDNSWKSGNQDWVESFLRENELRPIEEEDLIQSPLDIRREEASLESLQDQDSSSEARKRKIDEHTRLVMNGDNTAKKPKKTHDAELSVSDFERLKEAAKNLVLQPLSESKVWDVYAEYRAGWYFLLFYLSGMVSLL